MDIAHHTDLTFLAGSSEMAQRIRRHDWHRHPFGAPECWPQSLRTALGICLGSALPTALYWGPEFRLLYNDAWAQFAGPQHPATLGAPAQQVWPDIWYVLGGQLRQIAATGTGLHLENQLVELRRHGMPEETYWTTSLTAIRGEDGGVAGIFNSGFETTETVLSQRRVQILLETGAALAETTDSASAWPKALDVLGRGLGVRKAALAAPVAGRLAECVLSAADRPGAAPTDLGPAGGSVTGKVLDGMAFAVDDIAAAPHVRAELPGIFGPAARPPASGASGTPAPAAPPASPAALAAAGAPAAAALFLPCREPGRSTRVLVLQNRAPRRWHRIEIDTAREVAAAVAVWAERHRAAERARSLACQRDARAGTVLRAVAAITRHSMADTGADLRRRIDGRLAALRRIQTRLDTCHWQNVALGAILRQELAAHGPAAPDLPLLDGPAVALPPGAAQLAALIVHELAADAARRGALAQAGALSVCWSLRADDLLHLQWRETPIGQITGQATGQAAGTGAGQGADRSADQPARQASGAPGGRSPAPLPDDLFAQSLLAHVAAAHPGTSIADRHANGRLIRDIVLPRVADPFAADPPGDPLTDTPLQDDPPDPAQD